MMTQMELDYIRDELYCIKQFIRSIELYVDAIDRSSNRINKLIFLKEGE